MASVVRHTPVDAMEIGTGFTILQLHPLVTSEPDPCPGERPVFQRADAGDGFALIDCSRPLMATPNPDPQGMRKRLFNGMTGLRRSLEINVGLDVAFAGKTTEAMQSKATSLVSIIVRSTGRATLEQALASIDSQTYPACEIVVVDALGSGHRPLQQAPRRHPWRFVELGRRLLRPAAANAGLDAAQGALIGFLDEDDFVDPEHVANLVAASQTYGDAAVYSAMRILMEGDRLSAISATPFNLLALHYDNFIRCASVLFPRRFLDLGCRFDESLEVLEDWDFWLQIAQHAPLQLVPVATASYRATAGTSGVSKEQGSLNEALPRAWGIMRRKWEGRAATIWAPIEARLREAIRLHQTGQLSGALQIYREIQALSPNEPSSLHALAKAHLERGELAAAKKSCDIALQLAPRSDEFRLTRASIALAEGNAVEARTYAAPVRAPELAAAANHILAAAAGIMPPVSATAESRNAMCSCGSGRRRKDCCYRL